MDEKKSSTHRLAQGLGILLAALALLVQGRLLLAALLQVLILPLGSLLALTHGEEMSQVADQIQVCRSSAIGLLPLEAQMIRCVVVFLSLLQAAVAAAGAILMHEEVVPFLVSSAMHKLLYSRREPCN